MYDELIAIDILKIIVMNHQAFAVVYINNIVVNRKSLWLTLNLCHYNIICGWITSHSTIILTQGVFNAPLRKLFHKCEDIHDSLKVTQSEMKHSYAYKRKFLRKSKLKGKDITYIVYTMGNTSGIRGA